MHSPPIFRWPALAGVMLVLCTSPGEAATGSNMFCGGPATPGDPSDLANVVGDQTLEYAAQQPANIVTCAKGYLLAKCGDFETANKVFDKCIAAGYVGSMIWKALMLEDGSGTPRDLPEAARLMKLAANSGDPAYAPLGKLHYATMLHLGKGVARDEAAARSWFESAAADGNAEAQEFLRTGYHTGDRDQNTLGAGTPPPSALVRGLTGENASLTPPVALTKRADTPSAAALPRRILDTSGGKLVAPPPPPTAPQQAEAQPTKEYRRLSAAEPMQSPGLPADSWWMAVLVGLAFLFGIVHRRRTPRPLQTLSGKLA